MLVHFVLKDIVRTGPYPEQISYLLTSVGTQQNFPEKQKVKLLTLICLFVKRKFNKLIKISLLTKPTATNAERLFSVFNTSFD